MRTSRKAARRFKLLPADGEDEVAPRTSAAGIGDVTHRAAIRRVRNPARHHP